MSNYLSLDNSEKIELIKPENRERLLSDLQERTGLIINRVEIGKIDFLKDSANINIYYFEPTNNENLADDVESNDDDE